MATSSSWSISRSVPRETAAFTSAARRKCRSGTYTEPSYRRLQAEKGSGGLWNNAAGAPGKDPLVLADKPIGEWNTFRIIQVGARTTIYLNDKLVVDHAILENYWNRALPIPARGPIQLQTHDHEILWRNIAVREISPDEANQILAKHGADGFHSIFNGQNLADWAGPIENYEVKDGILRCKEHKGGTIYYNQELTDFMARVEFKLPPGGNNGLAIRYPGHGDTAYDGMCELQILDDSHPKYAKTLDPRQAHGSAYGMVAAHKGYVRPAGQWNFEEVTVKGSTDQGRAQRHRDPRHRSEQGQGIHGELRPPRQGPHVGILRLRRTPRPGRVPQCGDQDPGLMRPTLSRSGAVNGRVPGHSRLTAAGEAAGSSSNCRSRQMIWPAISTATKWPPGTKCASLLGRVWAIVQAIVAGTMLSAKPVPQGNTLVRRQVCDREPVMPVNRQFLRQRLRALPVGEDLVEVFHEQVVDLFSPKGLRSGSDQVAIKRFKNRIGIGPEAIPRLLKEPHGQVRVP